MKNLHLYLFLALLCLSAIYCSDNQNFQGRMNPQDRATELKERLDLTDDQTRKIEHIYQESMEKISEMRDQFGGDRGQMREKMIAYRDEVNKKIEDVLYEEQIDLYREFQEERRQSRRERQGQRQRQE